jgi:hypothetical protein
MATLRKLEFRADQEGQRVFTTGVFVEWKDCAVYFRGLLLSSDQYRLKEDKILLTERYAGSIQPGDVLALIEAI